MTKSPLARDAVSISYNDLDQSSANVPGAQASLKHLARLEEDQDLVADLARSGFTGRRYRRFEEELIRYSLSVAQAWIGTGAIFPMVARRGFNLAPTDAELNLLRRDKDECEELAGSTIAVTFINFRERALIGGGWDASRGARLTTYFMGATHYSFPNEFRRFRRARNRGNDGLAAASAVADVRYRAELDRDPADLAIGNVIGEQMVTDLPERTQRIVELHKLGFEHQEIAEILGDGEGHRKVEGVLSRWRKSEQAKRRRPGQAGGRD